MITRKSSPRLPNGRSGVHLGEEYVPYRTGVFPSDFPTRLVILKEATGLSWNGFSALLGVDPKQMRRWRKGAVPSGGVILALLDVAASLPGGIEVLRGRYAGRTDESHRRSG